MNLQGQLLWVAVLLAAGCASVRPARMVLPEPLAAPGIERTSVDGIGGKRRGQFTAGDYRGGFERSATRLAFFDTLYESRSGVTRFEVAGPGFNGKIEVQCRMQERAVTLGIVSFTPKPMSYRCEFDNEGRPIPARFELQESRETPGSRLLRRERRGEIAFDRVVLRIASVHALEGSPLTLATPIGYRFDLDARPIGAVELNGAPVIFMAPDATAGERNAVLMAALALGLFWDPADLAETP